MSDNNIWDHSADFVAIATPIYGSDRVAGAGADSTVVHIATAFP